MFYVCFALLATAVVIWFMVRTQSWLPATNRAVLIVGCDYGFGFAIVQRLVSMQVPVFATCFTEAGVKSLVTRTLRIDPLALANGLLTAYVLDVTDMNAIQNVKNAVSHALATHPNRLLRLWSVVNAASFNDVVAPDDWLNIDEYHRLMNVNCYGAIRVCHAFKPLIKQSRGRIIFLSSIRGRLAFPERGPYTMARFALEAYADTLRQDMYHYGVKVCLIEPAGFFTANSDRYTRKMETLWNRLDLSLKREWPVDCYYSRVKDLQQNIMESETQDLSPVVDGFEHALFAAYPQTRYVSGRHARFHYLPLTFLPGALQDFALRRWCQRHIKRPLPPV